MNKLKPAATAGLIVLLLGLMGQAQNDAGEATPDMTGEIAQVLLADVKPATKLEAFAEKKGAVIVKGYTLIATIPGENGASMQISAAALTDVTNQSKEFGLLVDILSGHGRISTTYVDYDEIEALASAVSYLEKADKNVTLLDNFEAQYRSRGDLWLTNFNDNGGRMVAIRSTQIDPTGQISQAVAYFRPAALAEINKQLLNAKMVLDKVKS